MNYFLDTSAIIKIYHSEVGTEFMRGLYRGPLNFTISELASLEFTSVMYRRCRAGDFGEELRGQLLSRFNLVQEKHFPLPATGGCLNTLMEF